MTTIKDAIDDLFSNPMLTTEDAVERHFDSAFRQRVNGTWSDRSAFVARIEQLRRAGAQVTMTVLDEFSEGDRYAERHVIELRMRDGARVCQEVSLFAKRGPDRRFLRIEETTLALAPCAATTS